MLRHQCDQRIMQHLQSLRHAGRAVGRDDAVSDVAEAVALSLDHTPTSEAQAWIDAEQSGHGRIGCLFLTCAGIRSARTNRIVRSTHIRIMAISLAAMHELRAPDALHAAIYRRFEFQLVTLDRRLATAARELGIAVVVPVQ